MARKLLKAGWIQLISALRPVMGYRQCLLLEQMISEMIVVTAMAVNVYVRLRQEMMESVTWMITKAIVCTNSDNMVNNNFWMYFFTEYRHISIRFLCLIYVRFLLCIHIPLYGSKMIGYQIDALLLHSFMLSGFFNSSLLYRNFVNVVG